MKSALAALMLATAPSPNLVTSARLVREEQVVRAGVLRDGRLAAEGDFWDTGLTAVLRPNGVLELDLGEVKPLGAALLQGDNNDSYLLWGSPDNERYELVWNTGARRGTGLRTRTTTSLNTQARYLRLTAEGGDGMYSVAELQVFSTPAELAASTATRAPRSAPSNATTWVLLAAFLLGGLEFLRRRPVRQSNQ